MSGIGRIFLVLNLLLSAAFLGWASHTLKASDNYRSQLEAEQAARADDAAAADDLANSLRADLEASQTTVSTLRGDLDIANANLETARTAHEDAQQDNDRMQENLTTMSSGISDLRDTLAELEAAKDAAVAEASQLKSERDDAVAAANAAASSQTATEDMLDAANMNIAQLEADLQAALASASRLDAQLATAMEVANLSWDDISKSQPYVTATVLGVKNDMGTGLVALNVGSDNQVTKGMTFEIWSGSQYKGQVRVESVTPDMCSALVTVPVPGASIAEGDSAATRL